jgi:hypothetical protein
MNEEIKEDDDERDPNFDIWEINNSNELNRGDQIGQSFDKN